MLRFKTFVLAILLAITTTLGLAPAATAGGSGTFSKGGSCSVFFGALKAGLLNDSYGAGKQRYRWTMNETRFYDAKRVKMNGNTLRGTYGTIILSNKSSINTFEYIWQLRAPLGPTVSCKIRL